jgi:hypothetical protein
MPLEYDVILAEAVTLEGRPANPESCYLLQSFQGLDGAELRDTVLDVADADGSWLGAQRRAGRTYIAEGMIVGATREDLRARERALRAVMQGGSRGTFRMRVSGRVGDPEDLEADVRPSARFASPDDGGGPGSPRVKAFQAALRSPSAVLEGANLVTVQLQIAETAGGLSFPMTFPLTFGGSAEDGIEIVHTGDARAWPLLTVEGYARGPILENLTTGQALHLPNLTIDTGETLEVDPTPGRRTIRLIGETGGSNNAYAELDRAASAWWALEPGGNELRLRATETDGEARMVVTFRNAYA